MADSPALDIFSIDTARLVDEAFGLFKVFPGIQPLFEARTSREQHGPAKQGRNEGTACAYPPALPRKTSRLKGPVCFLCRKAPRPDDAYNVVRTGRARVRKDDASRHAACIPRASFHRTE